MDRRGFMKTFGVAVVASTLPITAVLAPAATTPALPRCVQKVFPGQTCMYGDYVSVSRWDWSPVTKSHAYDLCKLQAMKLCEQFGMPEKMAEVEYHQFSDSDKSDPLNQTVVVAWKVELSSIAPA